MASRWSSVSWRRWIAGLFVCAISFALLLALTRSYCRLNPAVLVSDPTLTTTHLLHDLSGGEIAAHVLVKLPQAGPDGGDCLFVANDRYEALMSVKDEAVTFIHQRESDAVSRRLLAIDLPPRSGLLWSYEYPDTLSQRLVLVHSLTPDSVAKRFERIPALSTRRSSVNMQGQNPIAYWPEENPRLLYATMLSSGRFWPRGMIAYDAESGAVRWRYEMAQDPQMAIVRNLWGDERPEVVVAGWAPANMSIVSGSRCDTTCSLLALDSDGKERWYREAGHTFDYSTAVLGKMAPDETERLIWMITTHGNRSLPTTTMFAVDPQTGQTIAEQKFTGGCYNLVLADLDGDGNQEVIGGTSNGQLMVWNGRLHLLNNHRFDSPVSVHRVEDLDRDGHPDVLGTLGGRFCVWSDRLDLQAIGRERVVDPNPRLVNGHSPYIVVLREADRRVCVGVTDEDFNLRFMELKCRTPDDGLGLNARQIAPLIALALVLGLTTGGLVLRRRPVATPAGAETKELLPPAMAKALHQEISGMLHAVDRTNPLVRLQQLLDFVAKGNPAGTQQISRVADACQAFLAEGEPGLVRLTERLGEARAELPDLGRLEESYRRLTEIVRGMDSAGYAPGNVQAAAARGAELAGAALQSLRGVQATLRSRLRCDLLHALDHAVRGEMPQIRDAAIEGIDIHVEGSAPTSVLCEPGDLQTVLANLIHNSVRAMAGSPTRRLTFRVKRRASTVLLTVEDTGKGIERERWERIFGPDGSERKGGGFGLPHARRVLQEYKGWCEVEWSEPGRGTRMLLSFQSADGGKDAP